MQSQCVITEFHLSHSSRHWLYTTTQNLTAIFWDNTGKLVPECHYSGFYCSKNEESGGDNWTIRRAKLQSNRHHKHVKTLLLTGRMPFLSPNQQSQSTERLGDHLVSSLNMFTQILSAEIKNINTQFWQNMSRHWCMVWQCQDVGKHCMWKTVYN